ncbi:MAG: hypothetical protein WAM14_03115 [Candidatus Nitrosopolaris sp.]
MFVVAAYVVAIIVRRSAILPDVIATSNRSPDAIVSVCVTSANAPVVLDVIENVSLALFAFFLNTTVDERNAAVLTRHHGFDNVSADSNDICVKDSCVPLELSWLLAILPINVKNA